jgi:hypothetical protein
MFTIYPNVPEMMIYIYIYIYISYNWYIVLKLSYFPLLYVLSFTNAFIIRTEIALLFLLNFLLHISNGPPERNCGLIDRIEFKAG